VEKCEDLFIASLTDVVQMVDYARVVKPDLVIVGPEEPLGAGLVDQLEGLGIPCFGPPKELAQLETSKAWTRMLLSKYDIPGNIEYRVFVSTNGIRDYLEKIEQFVIKPDGLTGGKGVRVYGEHLLSVDDGYEYARDLVERDGKVVIEEKLEGEEFSIQSISDGEAFVHCPAAQDHKRALEGDKGPNTGGMGSYSCPDFSLPFLRTDDIERAQGINEAVGRALRDTTGRPYKGVLYGGFMATQKGVRLLEYNARFADPESMNVLPLLTTDFVEVCDATVSGRLGAIQVNFKNMATVCKYVVPLNYPTSPERDVPVEISKKVLEHPDVRTYFAAVYAKDGRMFLTGSRAIAFVGVGEDLRTAEKLAEWAASNVTGPVRHRKDIGTEELVESRVEHMRSIREGRDGNGGSRQQGRPSISGMHI
jgi:phosphoribosylamine--glycine ligase